MRDQHLTPKVLAVAGLGCAVAIVLAAALAWFAEVKWRRTMPLGGRETPSAPASATEPLTLPTHVYDELRARLDHPSRQDEDGWPTSRRAVEAAVAASAVPPIDPNHLELVMLNGPNGLVALVNGEKVTGKGRLRDGSHVLSMSEGQLVLRTADGVVHHLRTSER